MNEIDPIQKVEELTKEVHDLAQKHTQPHAKRYPLLFALLATFGITLVVHGFDGIISRTSFLKENPVWMFVVGFILLIITGTLYKKLN